MGRFLGVFTLEELTTKKDKEYHGIGLKSIKRIVEKYQGEFELEFKEKEVEATALLLNV